LPEKRGCITFDRSDALIINCNGTLNRRPLTFDTAPAPSLSFGKLERLPLHAKRGSGVAVSRDGRTLVMAIFNGALVRDGHGHVRRLAHMDCRTVSVSPDGCWAATGSHGGTAARVWQTDTGELVKEMLSDSTLVGVRFSPAGNYLAATSAGLHIYAVDTWQEVFKSEFAGAVGFSPDGGLVAVDDLHGATHLLETATGRELATLEDPNQDTVNCYLFTPDGTRLVAASKTGRAIRIWDLRLIRMRLAQLGLDWDAPPYLPAAGRVVPAPITVDSTALRLPLPGPEPALAPEAALAVWTLAIALQPCNPEAFYHRGHARSQLDDWSGARRDLDMAVRLNPSQADYYRERARICLALDDEDQRFADLNRLLDLEPNDDEANSNLAWLLVSGSNGVRDPSRALPLARKAARLAPHLHSCQTTLGAVLYRHGRFAEALTALKKTSAGQQPDTVLINRYLTAMCLQSLGETTKAREYYQLASASHAKTALTPLNARTMSSLHKEAAKALGLME
jgi:tetratricopeptide (TPR) repeat protein